MLKPPIKKNLKHMRKPARMFECPVLAHKK